MNCLLLFTYLQFVHVNRTVNFIFLMLIIDHLANHLLHRIVGRTKRGHAYLTHLTQYLTLNGDAIFLIPNPHLVWRSHVVVGVPSSKHFYYRMT